MKHLTIVAAALLIAAPGALAQDGPAEASDWGRCQAYYASSTGNQSSGGAAHNNTGFEGIDETCDEETSPPYEDTPAEEHAGEDPGKNAQDPGSQAPDEPGAPSDPGPPSTPDPPSDPGPPSTPSPPSDPGPPSEPGAPSTPDPPSTPSPPSHPGDPDQPNQAPSLGFLA